MGIAVSIYGLLEDLYSLKPEEIEQEIAELERRTMLLRATLVVVRAGVSSVASKPTRAVAPTTPPEPPPAPPPEPPPTPPLQADEQPPPVLKGTRSKPYQAPKSPPKSPTADRRSTTGTSEEEATAIARRIEECLLVNGSLTWDEIIKKARLSPIQAKLGIERARIFKGEDRRYRMTGV